MMTRAAAVRRGRGHHKPELEILPTTSPAATAPPPARSTKPVARPAARGPGKKEACALIQAFVGEVINHRRRRLRIGDMAARRCWRHDPAPCSATVHTTSRVREDFPALAMKVHAPLVYLDNAASAQKPTAVLDRMTEAYKSEYANVHRGLHYLANAATEAYEGGREKVAAFLNAGRTEEIIFTRNATEAINLVASSWGGSTSRPHSVSIMEHHPTSCRGILRERQARCRAGAVDDEGNFLIDESGKAADRPHQNRGDHPDVERARDRGSGQGRGLLAHARASWSTAVRLRCTGD
jgi:hypothetical protein